MRIAICQLNTTVGAFEANAAAIERYAARAADAGARLALFPELALCGYPPKDFLLLPEFVEREMAVLKRLARAPVFSRIAAVVGYAEPHDGPGTGLFNSAALIADGAVKLSAQKMLLPTYDVFDEGRYFDPGVAPTVAEIDGVRVGLSICEDAWNDKRFWPRRRYATDPMEQLAKGGAQLLVNISASPFALGKPALRARMLGHAAQMYGIPCFYCNLVGGNDALVFDGGSAVFGADGAVHARAKFFDEDLLVVDSDSANEAVSALPADLDALLDALVLGTRDYARKTGFTDAVLGLSGGIDSALTAVIAARALGPERVLGVAMPSRFTASISNEDAAALARTLGIRFLTLPIEPEVESYLATLQAPFAGRAPDVTEENLQARVRGTMLMALSNKTGALLLSTGNKSELATGYCTLYGDMAGGLAVIGDLPKTLVVALSRHINAVRTIIPERTITRPPTAELRENQRDEDALPPYDILDRVLYAYIEERLTVAQIVATGIDQETVLRVLGMVVKSEYKRRQAAPTLKVTARAFGEGWRFPIAHGYRI